MMDLDRVNNYLARVEESEKTTFKPVGSRLKVGVDLGTAYIVLVVLDEENNPVACEKQAAQVPAGRRGGGTTPGALRIVRSLKGKTGGPPGHGARSTAPSPCPRAPNPVSRPTSMWRRAPAWR